jgi:predicted PurR-regulated permease PerM
MLQFILALFMVFVVSFYLLSDGSKLRDWFKRTFFGDGKTFDAFFNEVDRDLSDVYIGNMLTAGVIAVLGSLVFSITNAISGSIAIPHPNLLGLLCGVTSLIPIAGVSLVWAPLTLYLILSAAVEGALTQSLPAIILFFLATFFIVDWLPNMLLRPRISSQKLHKGLLLLSYIFGPIVFGLKGVFLGPMILVLAADFSQIILPKLRKK